MATKKEEKRVLTPVEVSKMQNLLTKAYWGARELSEENLIPEAKRGMVSIYKGIRKLTDNIRWGAISNYKY